MSGLAEMIARYAQPGRIGWIGLRPARRQGMLPVEQAAVTEAGPDGDHGRPGKRAVTLSQGEHLAAIGSYLGRGPVAPELLLRNLVVEGLNLAALNGRRIRVGGAVLEITGICAPCSRIEAALGPCGYSALRGHGGWCAAVVAPGRLALGDRIVPLP